MPFRELAKRLKSGKKVAKPSPGRQAAGDFDILKQDVPEAARQRTRLRIGVHTSTAGGVELAVERANKLGANTLQIFSSSPRTWRPTVLDSQQCLTVRDLRERYDIGPMVVHTSYLVNLCSKTMAFLAKSIVAFRAEVQRALDLNAEYLVLHPGSFRGGTFEEGIATFVDSMSQAVEGMDFAGRDFKILIENTAGAEFSLGGQLEHVATLSRRLRGVVPVGVCIDTCHLHAAGYDVVSTAGFAQTLGLIDKEIGLRNVQVWHCNDAKSECGSHLDRHEHIGRGKIGMKAFDMLLNEPRTAHAAFIAETPIDEPGDDLRNVRALKALVRG